MIAPLIAAPPPLQASFARVQAANSYLPPLVVGPSSEPGWMLAADLFGPDQTDLRRLMAAAGATYHTTRRDFIAMTVFNQYGWALLCAALGTYLLDRRWFDLSLTNVVVHLGEDGMLDRIGVVASRCQLHADDAAASHPDAAVVPSFALGLDAVRAAIEAHFAPVIGAVRTAAPLGSRALWLALADNVAWCLLEFRPTDAAPGDRGALVAKFLQSPASQLRGATGIVEITHAGTSHPFVTRGSCCLSYKLPDGEKCSTCPLRQPADRDQRLRDYVSTLAATPAVGD